MTTATTIRPLGRRLMGGAYDLSGVENAEDARIAAGLDWEAIHVPLYAEYPENLGGGLSLMPKERAVVRDDTGEKFGVVGGEHKLLSNADFFDFADVLLREADTSWVEADPVGGALSGGKQPFLCLQLGDGVQVAGKDAVNCSILLSDGKVGNSSFLGIVNPLRVGCGNQVRAALAKLGIGQFTIQHSGDMAEKMVQARKGLAITSKYMREFADMANRMADIDFDLSDFSDFVAELLPISDDAGDRAKKTNAEQRGTMRLNWLNTTTIDADLKSTAWGAFNVVTETLDHGTLGVRKSTLAPAERRMMRTQFGADAKLRDRAARILVAA